jgi:antitoxin component YwqK of YwqJK toxin-antitoxin module
MKKLLPVVIVGLLCLVGCSKQEAEKPSEATSEEATSDEPAGLKEALAKKPRNLTENPLLKKGDQQVEHESLEPYSGKVFELHEDKKSVMREALLFNGKRHRLHTWYYEDGTKHYETNFKEGKQHGLSASFYPDGTKRVETNYKEDKKHGQHRAWNRDGKLIHEEDFQMGTGKWVLMRDNGTKSSETNYKEGKEHGLETSYYRDGTKRYESNFKEGKKHGLQTWYRKDGTKKEECEWSNGVEGECKKPKRRY